MFRDQRVVVVMPAYNAAKTLRRTVEEIDRTIVDDVILVDDASSDETIKIAEELKLHVLRHPVNRGYGGNQKTCYTTALRMNADIVVMLHPDYQYTPLLIPAMVSLIGNGLYDCVIGSRILGGKARQSGMPIYKYLANRLLTLIQNVLMGSKLTEFHTGYRAFSKRLLLSLPLEENSDDFVFDNQMLSQIIHDGFGIGEVACPTKYFTDASSINFTRSCIYGIGCLKTAVLFRLSRWNVYRPPIFDLMVENSFHKKETVKTSSEQSVIRLSTRSSTGPPSHPLSELRSSLILQRPNDSTS